VRRMARRPGTALNDAQARSILAFVEYYGAPEPRTPRAPPESAVTPPRATRAPRGTASSTPGARATPAR
jgi:hypothetical protein